MSPSRSSLAGNFGVSLVPLPGDASGSAGGRHPRTGIRDAETPETLCHERETADLLAGCIGGLTPWHDNLLFLRHECGFTFRQMGWFLHISESAAKQACDTAERRLRISLELLDFGLQDLAA